MDKSLLDELIDPDARRRGRRAGREEPVYVISVVTELVGVHAQTLRHYERVGLVRPARSVGNVRLYSERDIERIRTVVRLTNELGVNLAGVEVILNMRERMRDMQERMDRLRAEVIRLQSLH